MATRLADACSSTLASVMWCILPTPKINNIMATSCATELFQLWNLIRSSSSRQLGWSTHIGHVTSKASRMLGVVRRNLYNCPESVKETAYFSLVRPHTEYASVVWDPYQKNDKKRVERIQRSAARFVKSNYKRTKGTVTSLLSEIGWQSLEDRRRVARLTIMYKIVNEVDIPSDCYLTQLPDSLVAVTHKVSSSITPDSSHTNSPFSLAPYPSGTAYQKATRNNSQSYKLPSLQVTTINTAYARTSLASILNRVQPI